MGRLSGYAMCLAASTGTSRCSASPRRRCLQIPFSRRVGATRYNSRDLAAWKKPDDVAGLVFDHCNQPSPTDIVDLLLHLCARIYKKM